MAQTLFKSHVCVLAGRFFWSFWPQIYTVRLLWLGLAGQQLWAMLGRWLVMVWRSLLSASSASQAVLRAGQRSQESEWDSGLGLTYYHCSNIQLTKASQSHTSPDARGCGRFHSLTGGAKCLIAKGTDTERGTESELVLHLICYNGQSVFVLEWLER